MTPPRSVTVGPERIVLTDGLQPFAFRTRAGTIWVQGQLSFPPGYVRPKANAFPGIPGNVISRDNGETWRRWYPRPMDGPDRGPTIEGAVVQRSDGTVLIFDWVAQGPNDAGDFIGGYWQSQDDLQTLDGPRPFRIHLPQGTHGYDDGGHPYHAVTLHRTVLELPGGDLFTAAYGWFKGDDAPVRYQPKMRKFRSFGLRSSDAGLTWRLTDTIGLPLAETEEGLDEPALVRVSRGNHAGRLLCVMRSGSFDQPLYQSHSDDEGATWSPPRKLAYTGVDPDMVEMSDGTLVLAVGVRTKRGANVNGLSLSTDGGDTWGPLTKLPLETYAVANHETTSYMSVCKTGERELLAFYDVGWWGASVRYLAARRVTLSPLP